MRKNVVYTPLDSSEELPSQSVTQPCTWLSRCDPGMSPAHRIPLPFDYPFTRVDLDAAGLSYAALRGWLERGECRRLGTGLFVRADLAEIPELTAIWSARRVATGRAAVSAYAAALLHKLPVPRHLPATAHEPIPLRALPTTCRTNRGALVVPSLEWTCLLLSRGQRLAACLIPLDAAAKVGLDLPLAADLYATTQRMGLRHFATALNEVDAKSGSPLESASRGWLIEQGLPRPELQHPFVISGGKYFVDFFWPQFRVIGEADGLGKYADGQELARERRRQSALDSSGCRVVRWGWHDLEQTPQQLFATMRLALREPGWSA